jgi:SIR2-like domain
MSNSWKDLFPNLISAYDQGKLVPFLGAGASVGGCTLWPDFVTNLERNAGISVETKDDSPTLLIQRAARATLQIKYRFPNDRGQFTTIVRSALRVNPSSIPFSCQILAKVSWPLVITTNYDDWFYKLWNLENVGRDLTPTSKSYTVKEPWNRMVVCGRSRLDCQRVLASLRRPDNPIMWAVQGFLGGQAVFANSDEISPPPNLQLLEQEVVIGHEEYRREGLTNQYFRRAFAEVFRSRSLLFVGSNLSEEYFRSLFDEIIEFQGANPTNHFALMKRGAVDREFLLYNYQIRVVEYEDHNDVPEMLSVLTGSIGEERPRPTSWSYSFLEGAKVSEVNPPPLAVIRRRKLPRPSEGECLLLSAGIQEQRVVLGSKVRDSLIDLFPSENFVELSAYTDQLLEEPYLWRHKRLPIFFLAARARERDERDARIIKASVASALKVISKQYHSVEAMLLAAGPGRVFPPFVALVEMIRGLTSVFNDGGLDPEFRNFSINVIDPGVIQLIRAGKLNLQELLLVGLFRIGVEIWRSENEVLRLSELISENTEINEIRARYYIPGNGWLFMVEPSPTGSKNLLPNADENGNGNGSDEQASALGLFPGATLRFYPQHLRSMMER